MMMSRQPGLLGVGWVGNSCFCLFNTLHLFYAPLSEGLVQSSGTHLDVQGGAGLREGQGFWIAFIF